MNATLVGTRALVIACVLASALAATAHAQANVRRYAVVVAENDSLDGDVPSLKYADDDGAAYYALLSEITDDVTLLAVLDADTQRQYRGLASKSAPPTLANLRAALVRVNAAMDADRKRGDPTVFYFVYAGHGAVGNGGEGYVNLHDVRFTRSDLFREVLARSTADQNHLIIDACNSYFLVNARGDEPEWKDDRSDRDHAEEVGRFLAAEDLAQYPNTGVILSTSSAEETHEWGEYRAGIFSHEVRSALTGAADVNSDGRVEYSEVKAFVAAANAAIDDPKARLAIFASAPRSDGSAALVDLGEARFEHFLKIPKGVRGHLYLEDDRGVRYADLHSDGERDVIVGLPDANYYYLRSDSRELRIDPLKPGVHLATGKWRSLTLAARGSTSDSYRRGLFATAYGADFYRGYVVLSGDVPVEVVVAPWRDVVASQPHEELEPRHPLRKWMWVASGTAVAAGVSALVLDSSADRAYEEILRDLARTGVASPGLVDNVRERRTARDLLLGVTAVSAGAGLTFYLWDRHRTDGSHSVVSVHPTGDVAGLMVGVDARF